MSRDAREGLAGQDREHLLQTTRRLLAEVQALSSRIAAINEIATAINRTLDVDEILRIVSRQAKWILDFSHCSVCSREKDGALRFISLFGPEPSCTWLLLQDNDPIALTLAGSRVQLFRHQVKGAVLAMYHSCMVIALESEQEILGTLNVAIDGGREYTQDDVRIGYLLALQLAAALRNARRYRELQELYSALDAEKQRSDGMVEELGVLNAHLLDANDHLQNLDREKNELLGIVAHDLKNPLAGIILTVSTIRHYHSRMTADDMDKRLTSIEETAGRMRTIIDNLLELNAIESGVLRLSCEKVDIAAISAQVCNDYRERARRKQIVLHEPVLSAVAVQADAGALHEILDNLVSNAVKYSPPGLSVYVSVDRTDDGMVRWSVRDEGPGLTDEDKQRVFGKFARLSARPTAGEDSTGLGLSIVKKLTEAMNGHIRCSSVYGQGAVFSVELPAAE